MAKKSVQSPARAARTCGLRGCVGSLDHGNGLGCDSPECSNFWKKWSCAKVTGYKTNATAVPEDFDDRAALMAAIKARKKKASK